MALADQVRERVNSSRTIQKGKQDDYRSNARPTFDR